MNKFFKSVSCLLLALLMGFSVACGETNAGNNNDNNTNTEQPGGGNEDGGNTEQPGGGNEGGGNTEQPGGGNEGGGNTEQPGGGNTEQPGGGNTEQPGGGNEGGEQPPDVPAAQYTIEQTVSALDGTIYTNTDMTDDKTYGLQDISNVGVVQATENQELYPIDTTDCEIIEYSDISGANDYAKLSTAFSQAKALNANGQKAVIMLPQNETLHVNAALSSHGQYTFALDGYNGLYVQGNGSTIMIDYDGMNYKGFLYMSSSADVHFNDLRVDYSVPTALTGVIKEYDLTNRTVTIEVNSEFNTLVNRLKTTNARIQSYMEFNWRTSAPMEGGNFVTDPEGGFIQGYAIMGDEASGYSIMVQFVEGVTITDRAKGHDANLAFSMYGRNGFDYTSCQNVYMENVTLNTCPGMGLVGSRTTNMYINRFKLALPQGSKRLLTASADGTHFEECYGDVKITNSIIEYTHDDALNIKSGYYYNLSNMDVTNKTFSISARTQTISVPNVGDTIEFYNKDTFQYLGYAKVASVTAVGGGEHQYNVTASNNLRVQDASSWGNSVVATNVTKTAKLTFTNNVVRNKRNRGLLVQVRDALIANNTFQNVGHGSISVHSALDQFNEATMPKNIVIENNKFINNNYLLSLKGDIQVFAQNSTGTTAPIGTITDIIIRNNYFSRNGNAGVSLQAVSSANVENNLFYNNGRVNAGEMYDCAVELTNTGGSFNASTSTLTKEVVISGNYMHYDLINSKHAGIVTGGTTNPDHITLQDNVNLEYKKYQVVIGTTEVKKLTSSITVDGNLADWGEQGNAVPMIGHSLADGGEYTLEDYEAYFKVKDCRIAWSDDGIYIAFAVKDNILDFTTVNNFWLGDCFELFLCTDLSLATADLMLKAENTSADVMQFAATASNTWADKFTVWAGRTSAAIVEGKSKIKTSCVTTADGYAGEVFLPFEVFKNVEAAKNEGKEVAMAFVFADALRKLDDGNDRKRLQVANLPHHVESYKTITAGTPLFKFVEE